jgi:hypothetical protein
VARGEGGKVSRWQSFDVAACKAAEVLKMFSKLKWLLEVSELRQNGLEALPLCHFKTLPL